jgi:hypothetical protein
MSSEHLKKKAGRPKRCPIQCLQTQVLMHSLCEELGVPHTGGQLERIFEKTYLNDEDLRDDGTRQRNGKYRRLLKGQHCAAPRTMKEIQKNKHTQYSIKLYYSSLWQALAPHNSLNEWLNFFRKLRPSLQSIALTNEPSDDQLIKQINRHTANKLLREGDIEALACGIALHRASPFSVWKGRLSCAVAKLMGWVLAEPAFDGFEKQLGNFVYNHYGVTTADLTHYDRNFCTPNKFAPYFFIFELAKKNREFINMAKTLGLLRSPKDHARLFYLSDRGDKQRIFDEMQLVLIKDHYELVDSGKGLYWLTQELDKHHKEKLSLFEANDTYDETYGFHKLITPILH